MVVIRMITFSLLFALLATSHQARAHDGEHEGRKTESSRLSEGRAVVGMRVVDVFGQAHRLGTARSAVPVALVFLSDSCPVSRRYLPELNTFKELSASNGVSFYGVLADRYITAKAAREFVQAHGFSFPVVWDPSGELVRRLAPTVTPEAFVLSSAGELIYRGRIDNRFASIGVLRGKTTAHDLRDAVIRAGAGAPIEPRVTAPIGCFVESGTQALPETVTYRRDIAPLIAANCAECHREGSVAPFALETFDQVRRRARMISHVTAARIMPPWPAAPGIGQYRDERSLSQDQIDLLSAWLDGGTPLGEPDDAIPPPVWPARDWLMGEPDVVIEMEEAFPIPAGGPDIYRYFVIPVDIPDGHHLVGLEFRPGDPQAVHHSLVYIDYTGRARAEDAKDNDYGFSVFGKGGFMSASNPDRAIYLGGWAPGIDPINLPPGHGMPIDGRPGDAVFEVHYRPTGLATEDRSRIGLYLSKGPIENRVAGTVAGTLDVNIAPEDADYWRQVYMNVPADMRLIAVSPHMHYIGKEVVAVATLPDGTELPLLHIPNWDFRWQNVYIFREPVEIPAGSRIDAWFKFDNSSDNPSNPHAPPGWVRWGWSSDEEMCELWMRFTAKDDASIAAIRSAGNRSWGRLAEPSRPPPAFAQ